MCGVERPPHATTIELPEELDRRPEAERLRLLAQLRHQATRADNA